MSTPIAAGTLSGSSPATSRARTLRRWRRRIALLGESTPATVGIVVILAWVALALLAPLIAPYPPNANDMTALAHTTPSRAHWLGADHLGRDILSRILWGARPARRRHVPAHRLQRDHHRRARLPRDWPAAARSRLGRHGQGHVRDDDGVAAHGAVPVRGDLVPRRRLQPARGRAAGAGSP